MDVEASRNATNRPVVSHRTNLSHLPGIESPAVSLLRTRSQESYASGIVFLPQKSAGEQCHEPESVTRIVRIPGRRSHIRRGGLDRFARSGSRSARVGTGIA